MYVENVLFSDLDLPEFILKVLDDLGYETPSPIQAKSIPLLLAGHDVLGQAQTGTGKTAAFALPALNKLDVTQKATQVLVLTPTRELAIQVAEAFQRYARFLNNFHVLPIYGGQPIGTQLKQLRRGPQVVVGTPGRIIDHMRRKSLALNQIRMLVLDEADEMLNMGFIEDIDWIFKHTPQNRQVALFSATMPKAIQSVAREHLKHPQEVRIKSQSVTTDAVDQYFWRIAGVHKLDALTRFLEVEQTDGLIIFVKTKNATLELADKLKARGFECASLNGDMSQHLREKTVEQLKEKKLDIVVATDVAARGINIERISHVINYDIPYDPEAYVHRIGRTGRAGRSGKAILFVAPREFRLLRSIERMAKVKIKELFLPTLEHIAARRIARMKEELQNIKAPELTVLRAMSEEFCRDLYMQPLELATALLYLMQKDKPFLMPEESEQKLAKKAPKETHIHIEEETKNAKKSGYFDNDGAMKKYRVNLGRSQGVSPNALVGALIKSLNLPKSTIGKIQLYEHHSTVYLPTRLQKSVLSSSKRLSLFGKRFSLESVITKKVKHRGKNYSHNRR